MIPSGYRPRAACELPLFLRGKAITSATEVVACDPHPIFEFMGFYCCISRLIFVDLFLSLSQLQYSAASYHDKVTPGPCGSWAGFFCVIRLFLSALLHEPFVILDRNLFRTHCEPVVDLHEMLNFCVSVPVRFIEREIPSDIPKGLQSQPSFVHGYLDTNAGPL